MGTARIAKWDNAKFILILLVVVGHMADLYSNSSQLLLSLRFFIYIFHMPAFLFVSGMMSKRSIENNNWDKALSFLVLYFAVKFLHFIVNHIVYGTTLTLFSDSGRPWFMLALFFMNIITFYTKKFKPIWVLAVSLILSVFAGYGTGSPDFLSYLRVINFYPYFYLGYILNPDKLLEFLNKRAVRIGSFSIMLIGFVLCRIFINDLYGIMLLLSGRNFYSSLQYGQEFGGLLRLAVFASGLILTLSLISISMNSRTFFTKFGERTLAIYATHCCLFYVLSDKLRLEEKLPALFPHFWPVIPILIGILLTFLCANKYFDMAFQALADYKRWLKPDRKCQKKIQ